MKKSEIAGIKPATVEEIAAKSAEQIRYQQALTLIPKGAYNLELVGGSGANKNKVAVYYPEYAGTDGQPHTFMAVCLKETGDLIPVANLEQTTYVDDRNNFVVSQGFTSEKDDDTSRWEALNATTKKFNFDVKKLRRVGGRRAMNKALVTFI
jgi:hypothetical protein